MNKTIDNSIFLAAIVNTLNDSAVSVDLDGIVTSWNTAAENLYGYSAAEAIGQSVFMLTLPEEVKIQFAKISDIKAGIAVPLHSSIHITQLGNALDLEVLLSPVKDEAGKIVGISTITRNVSEFTALRATAHQSKSRFETLTNTVPQIIWENDTDGKANYFNQRFIDYSGRSFSELTGPGWQLIAHPDAQMAVQAWTDALSQKDIFESEVQLRRFDGVYQWHLLRNVPLKDSNGEVIGWFGSATNINEMKSLQIALRESVERMQITMETASEFAIITMDKEGYIIDWNNGAERIFGYKRAEALGQFCDLIFTPEDKFGNIPAQELEIAKTQGRAADERWHIHKDGTRFFMSGVMAPIRDHMYAGYVKIARNITERKIAEEALLLSEQRKSLAVQTAQMGEWEWDLTADKVLCSAQACYLLGRTDEAEHITGDEFFGVIHEQDIAGVKLQLDTAFNGLHIFQAECRIIRADNHEIRWMNMYGRVVAHHENKVLKMIGVIYDITERKTLEKQKDDFISVASHELKTPLTTVKAYSDLMGEIFAESGNVSHAKLAIKLKQQVDRIVALIHTLLDSNTIIEGKMTLHYEAFDINELIAEQVRELQLVASTHTLEWVAVQLPLIHADRNRIRQVLTNFITNAIKYSPENTKIIITAKDDLDGLTVSVQDFGLGIPGNEQGRIFERYYRSAGPQTLSFPGLGLGLYICAEIIAQHHGSIGVDSVAGYGSTFYFKLPYK